MIASPLLPLLVRNFVATVAGGTTFQIFSAETLSEKKIACTLAIQIGPSRKAK